MTVLCKSHCFRGSSQKRRSVEVSLSPITKPAGCMPSSIVVSEVGNMDYFYGSCSGRHSHIVTSTEAQDCRQTWLAHCSAEAHKWLVTNGESTSREAENRLDVKVTPVLRKLAVYYHFLATTCKWDLGHGLLPPSSILLLP